MPESPQLVWSEIQEWRQKYRKTFPRIRRLPILPSLDAWLIGRVRLMHHAAGQPVRILDIGAGDRALLARLEPVRDLIDYKSQDIDTKRPHDYYSFSDIRDRFDIVVVAEVIEHLRAVELPGFLKAVYEFSADGGWVAVTTPNVCHPNVFWRDFSHITPMHYYDLSGLLARSGYGEIAVYRLAKLSLYKRLVAWWYRNLLELLHCDFAQSILAVGRK